MKDFGSGKYEAAFQGFKKMQRLQPTNFELYIAAGQARTFCSPRRRSV